MDASQIIVPIANETPCGADVREDPATQNRYYEVKDARHLARSDERATVPGEPIRLSPAWNDVRKGAFELLTTAGKDIELLAWLAEAELRLSGFAGLCDVLDAAADLVETHWDRLHSVDQEALEDKVAPLSGLNGVSAEGTLIQPIRLTPLVPHGVFGKHNLWDYQLSQRADRTDLQEALNDAITTAGAGAMAEHLARLQGCLDAVTRLDSALTERCGDKAPSTANIRTVLQEAASAIRVLAGLSTEEADQDPAPSADAEDGHTPVPDKTGVSSPKGIEITTREEALDTLLRVARYFRRYEPHSPMSLSLETLVRRARMDFSELLAELLPEQQARNGVLIAAGIQPKAEQKGE